MELSTILKSQSHTALFLQKIMRLLKIKYRRHLGKLLHISEDKISKYMNYGIIPSYETCLQIQDALHEAGIEVEIEDIRPRKIE